MHKKTLLFILLASISASAQLQRYDSFAGTTASASGIGNLTQVIPGATLSVFNYPGPGVSCAGGGCTAASTFTSRTGLTACGAGVPLTRPTATTCLATADAQGNFGFWAFPGGYQYCVAATSITTQCFNIVLGTGGNSNIVFVDTINTQAWAGADACAWIGSAISSLPTNGGTVDARGVQGTISCAGGNFLNGLTVKPVKVLLGSVTINAASGFLFNAVGWNDFQLIGQEGQTKITETPTPGTLIQMCGAGASPTTCTGATSPLLRVHISGLTLNGSATDSQTHGGQLGIGIFLSECQQCEVDHNRIAQFAQSGIQLASTSSSINALRSRIHDNWITSTWGSNILLTQFAQENEIISNTCFNTERNCIDVNGQANKIIGNTVNTVSNPNDTADKRGINIFEAAASNINNTENLIANNYVKGTDQECIRIESDDIHLGDRVSVVNNTLVNCGTGAGAGNPASAIGITSSGGSFNVTIAHNRIETPGKAASTTGGGCIEADGLTNAAVTGNTCRNPQTNCYTFNTSSFYTVVGNVCNGSRQAASGTFGGFLFNISGVNDVITGNADDGVGSFSLSFTQSSGTMANYVFSNNWPSTVTTTGTVTLGDNSANSGAAAGCATGAAAGSTCTTTVSWAIPFLDGNYNNATCIGVGITSGVPVAGGITTRAAGNIVFQTVAGTAAAAQYTNILCTAAGNK